MTKYEADISPAAIASPAIETDWSVALSAQEWDERFPGVLDFIGALGGPANVILQLALPPVGYGVLESPVESGSVLKNPSKRARTTATYIAVAMLGSREEKLAYRQAVNRVHSLIRSTSTSPVRYNAFNPELQLWVAACLYWGFVNVNTRFSKPWSAEQKAGFYQLAATLGTTLQMRADMWPADIHAFQQYWDSTLATLRLDPPVRQFLRDLIELKHRPRMVSKLLGPAVRFITTGFLPQRLREEMHYEWSHKDQRNFDRLIRTARALNRLLPRRIRQAGALWIIADFRERLQKEMPLT